jgi:hypothetical protein
MEINGVSYFTTSNFALCGYLEVRGLKYVKADLSKDRKDKINVVFYFLDPNKQGQDFELEFRFSSEKKYRDALFYYKKIIQELLGS